MTSHDSETSPEATPAESDTPSASLFELHGVKLEIPSKLLAPRIRQAIESGKYEHLEARQLPRFLQAGDRLLEFGAGLGFISSLCSKIVPLSSCAVVEANPELIPVIRRNHSLNGVVSDVINTVALSPRSTMHAKANAHNQIPFYVYENFWGSSLVSGASARRAIDVDITQTQVLIDKYKPTVIICDIEGGEVDLFDECNLDGVNRIFFEVHKSIIGLAGINKVIHVLASQGLYYDPDFSVGATVMFSRP